MSDTPEIDPSADQADAPQASAVALAMAQFDLAVGPVIARLPQVGLVGPHELRSLATAIRSGLTAAIDVLVNGPPAPPTGESLDMHGAQIAANRAASYSQSSVGDDTVAEGPSEISDPAADPQSPAVPI